MESLCLSLPKFVFSEGRPCWLAYGNACLQPQSSGLTFVPANVSRSLAPDSLGSALSLFSAFLMSPSVLLAVTKRTSNPPRIGRAGVALPSDKSGQIERGPVIRPLASVCKGLKVVSRVFGSVLRRRIVDEMLERFGNGLTCQRGS